jgi:hypothetical protein
LADEQIVDVPADVNRRHGRGVVTKRINYGTAYDSCTSPQRVFVNHQHGSNKSWTGINRSPSGSCTQSFTTVASTDGERTRIQRANDASIAVAMLCDGPHNLRYFVHETETGETDDTKRTTEPQVWLQVQEPAINEFVIPQSDLSINQARSCDTRRDLTWADRATEIIPVASDGRPDADQAPFTDKWTDCSLPILVQGKRRKRIKRRLRHLTQHLNDDGRGRT